MRRKVCERRRAQDLDRGFGGFQPEAEHRAYRNVRGESGDTMGNFKFTTATIPGVAAPVRVYDGAFRQFHEAREYTVGVNYFFKRHLLKWQTDVGVFGGGNPAGTPAGSGVTGWIAGSDGYLIRTQVQLAF